MTTHRYAWPALFLLALAALLALHRPIARADGPRVDVVTIRGVIDAVNSQYLARAIDRAAADGAAALVITLDTPGGLDSSMRTMTQKILASPVPIVAYVSPPGARAGSAGVFLVLAADVAAMAPGTNIGAAHPVTMGQAPDPVLSEKMANDAAALARTLAAQRGRNPAWAEQAVKQSSSITEREALADGVVDLVAADLDDLLAKLDGRETAGGQVIRTRGATVHRVELTWLERIVHALVDPNIAYILLTVGIWALIAEFYHPGALLPGITGVICLVLAFVAFESLPISWAGVALLVLAMILFGADVLSPTHGALTLAGATTFVVGSLLLFSPLAPGDPTLPEVRVSPALIGVMTAGIAAFFLFALGAGLRAQRAPRLTGALGPVGAFGVACSDLTPGETGGMVLVRSETWSALPEEPIAAGEPVEVIGRQGLRLLVRRSRSEDRA